ncbi:MAG: sulfatase, partial [Anaerolineales bacterium]
GNDYDIASTAVEAVYKNKENINSLFLGDLYKKRNRHSRQKAIAKYVAAFPNNPPEVSGNPYLLETAIDWLVENTPVQPRPYLSYFHFLPPHAPYDHTRAEFQDTFYGRMDEYLRKPEHIFSQGQVGDAMSRDRNDYDNYILYVDAEFDRLISELEDTGALENTWVILTSDHGELFERGIIGHSTPAMFAPLLHVPLFIFGPGVNQREDITTNTSSLDLLPTILQLAGKPVPDWVEGEVLPWFRTAASDPDRSIYGVNAKHNDKFKPLTHVSISMLKANYRLSAYLGYPELNGETRYELYDLENDPYEMEDIFASKKEVAGKMVAELNAKLEEVDRPYGD